jgi:hypothetical protein
MAEIITENILWKVGERGNQQFEIYDSDGKARHNGTGHTYDFKFWDDSTEPFTLIGSGVCAVVDAVNGKYEYPVKASDTMNEAEFAGELIEDLGAVEKRTNTFKVKIEPSSKDAV